MNGRPLPDEAARRRIREDLDATLFVEAAAGTGKTTALVERIVALVMSGRAALDRIVAVTFTEKAVGEMKLRLRSEIERARGSGPSEIVGERLDRALETLELARINTIHALCADLLHERPIEAGVDPGFEVLGEEPADALLRRAFDRWFQRVLDDPPEGVRRVLRRPPFRDERPSDALFHAVGRLVKHRDFDAPWTRAPLDREPWLHRILVQLAELASLCDQAHDPEDFLAQNLRNVSRFLRENRHRRLGGQADVDGIEGALRSFRKTKRSGWHWTGRRSDAFGPELERSDVVRRRDEVALDIDRFILESDADLAALLREELRPVVAGYQELKREIGRLDFLDLLIRTRDLLRDRDGVRRELQHHFTHVFVDEFQDTDPLQAEILLLLVADDPAEIVPTRVTPVPGKLFVVGDPKQSIYRFRRADVALYEGIKNRLVDRGVDVIQLATSFRSVPSIQEAVNAAFEPVMHATADGSSPSYVSLERWRDDPAEQPTVVALPVPRPYGDFGTITQWAVDASYPEAVGAFVHWLVTQSGWKVTERTEGNLDRWVNVQARHVCILFRRLVSYQDDVTRLYVAGLESHGIPHVLVGGRSYHERDEVLGVRNVLQAIEWPDDELHVFAALKGPFFSVSDNDLLVYRERYGSLHPLRPRDPAAMEPPYREVAEALEVLGELHWKRNRRPIAQTLSRFLESVRAHAGVALQRAGEQGLANVLRAVDLARRFEKGGAPSFRAFVDRMVEEAERGGVEDAPIVEEGTDGVRIMTVHKAKGLEFPVVILADPTCTAVRDVPTKHVDVEGKLWAETLCGCAPRDLLEARDLEMERDIAEAHRVAYVAATRARDLLVVPVVGDLTLTRSPKEEQSWLDPLRPVVYPPDEDRGRVEPAGGVPAFGKDSVLERPSQAKRPREGPVAPGIHRPAQGRHRVLWWDPAALVVPAVSGSEGERIRRVLATDGGDPAAEAGAAAHADWRDGRARTLETGSRATRDVHPVARLAEEGEEQPAGIILESTSVDRAIRPRGKRFGALVHAALEAVDLGADEDAVARVVRVVGRQVGAGAPEIEAAVPAVVAALGHPLVRRAAASRHVRRETPVMFVLEDGRLAEGVVDLAFRESDAAGVGSWTVIDFKTDRELAGRRGVYLRQVALYSKAVSRATGEAAVGVLLSV